MAKRKTSGGPYIRRVTPIEHAQLKKLVEAAQGPKDVLEEAAIAFEAAKANYNVAVLPAARFADGLRKRYKMKPNEEVDIETGIIRLISG